MLFKPVFGEINLFQKTFDNYNKTMKLVLVSIFACMAAILQSAGGFLPGIGYLISPLATAPILLCTVFSIPFGVMAYVVTIMLLVVIQPTELIIFPFTTGLLALGIGAALHFLKVRLNIIIAGAIALTLGIVAVLYIFQFPILGPVASSSFSLLTTGSILLFSLFYSWLWVEISLKIIKRLNKILA